jgi:hypothetical protein
MLVADGKGILAADETAVDGKHDRRGVSVERASGPAGR